MTRCFIAIELSAEIRSAIGDLQSRLKRAPLSVRVSWTKLANIHLTLQFLGNIPDDLVPRVTAALATVAGQRTGFDLDIGEVGAFPNASRPRVLWVGATEPTGRLTELVRGLQTALAPLGFPPEKREFTPHLTLGRIRHPRPDAALTRLLDSLKDSPCGSLRVRDVHLFESQLDPQGSIYTKLSSHDLRGD